MTYADGIREGLRQAAEIAHEKSTFWLKVVSKEDRPEAVRLNMQMARAGEIIAQAIRQRAEDAATS